MKKAYFITMVFFLAVALVIGMLYLIYLNKSGITGEAILFYGEACPHCKIVDDFIEKNNIDSKIEIIRKEVFSNSANAAELADAAKVCNISQLGVPFLYTDGKCYVGDREVIDFLREKLNITTSD